MFALQHAAHTLPSPCFACCFCHCTGGGECKILALRTCTRNGFNLISLIKGAAQLELQHHVANKAIHTQKETEVYMHTHAKRNRSIYAKRTLHVADANANAFATAFDLALPSCRYTRVEESTEIPLGLQGSFCVFMFLD